MDITHVLGLPPKGAALFFFSDVTTSGGRNAQFSYIGQSTETEATSAPNQNSTRVNVKLEFLTNSPAFSKILFLYFFCLHLLLN